MRQAFIEELLSAAEKNPNIYLLTGDLGFSVFEPFIEKFPQRYINTGAAEQNMVGVATGLALSGKMVFVYSIANFPTLRCLEQIRNDVCYHQANVKIVSVGTGFTYGLQGYTHFGVEDISILRCLPSLKVISPADPFETRLAMRHLISHDGPSYLRLGGSREKVLHTTSEITELQGMIPIIHLGNKSVVLSTGTITTYVLEKIKNAQISCDLWSVPIISPIDKATLAFIAQSAEKIITVEEHQLAGGFGSAILEALLDLKNSNQIPAIPHVERIGFTEIPTQDLGNQDYIREKMDYSALLAL